LGNGLTRVDLHISFQRNDITRDPVITYCCCCSFPYIPFQSLYFCLAADSSHSIAAMPWWTSVLCSHFCSCLSTRPFCMSAGCRLSLNARRPHIEMKFMHAFSDVWAETVGLAATGRVATNGGSAGTPLTTCSNGGSAGTPLIGYERWHCLHKGKPEVLDAFYATPKPIHPGASLATARWA